MIKDRNIPGGSKIYTAANFFLFSNAESRAGLSCSRSPRRNHRIFISVTRMPPLNFFFNLLSITTNVPSSFNVVPAKETIKKRAYYAGVYSFFLNVSENS